MAKQKKLRKHNLETGEKYKKFFEKIGKSNDEEYGINCILLNLINPEVKI